jgi:Zn-dependent protease
LFGIDIRIHITFFLILLLGAYQWGSPFGVEGALFGVLLMILLFACVTLHELGHSLAARYYGIATREIILLPVGGLALLARVPSKPVQELVIAAAGPFVNVVIAGALLLLTGLTVVLNGMDVGSLLNVTQAAPSLTTLLLWLLQANIALVVFNLIPAFPLDGGRIFRAVLALFTDYRRATRIATITGQGIAIAIGILGLMTGNFLLALVAVFIFVGAGQENNEGQARTVLTTLRVGDAYNKHALTLDVGDRVSKVVDYILTSYQPDYAVMQGHTPIGIVSRDDVLRTLGTDPRDAYVTGIMRRDVVRVEADATLDRVRELMGERGVRVVAVYSGENYLGLVSIEDIAEAFAVISFLDRQRGLRQAGSPSM